MKRTHILFADGHSLCGAEDVVAPPGGTCLWIDFEGASEEELQELVAVHRFHPLAVEDCLHRQKRPKYERYSTHNFLVVLALDSATPAVLDTAAVRIFWRGPLVVTVHKRPLRPMDRVRQLLRDEPEQIGNTPERVLHAIMDSIVDEFVPLLGEHEERLDVLEERTHDAPTRELMEDLLEVRRELLTLRRIIVPQQEVLRRLMDSPEISEESQHYLRDVLDHVMAVGDSAQLLLEVCSGAMQTHANAVNDRTNKVMKYMAVISTLMLPMTVISGTFGMNFEVIPAAHHPAGFWLAVGGMFVSGVVLLTIFRWRRWF